MRDRLPNILPAGSGLAPEPVLRALAEATSAAFPNLARQFVHRWAKTLGAQIEWGQADPPLLLFRTAIAGLYLRGFEDIPCWLLPPGLDAGQFFGPGGRGKQSGMLGSEEIPVVICPLEEMEQEALAVLPKNRAVVLGPVTLHAILSPDSARSRAALAQAIRSQVHALRLQPFDTTRPVAGDMFFGRAHELDLLRYEREWFLITGPSRIGKSSLLAHYRYLLRKESDPRLARSFYVNLQPCSSSKEDDTARYIAMHFRSVSTHSGGITMRELRSFLFSVIAGSGGPIEIILDEADAVCHTDLLVAIGEFAQASGSRLIVIGRGAVRHHWQKQRATAFGRLRDLRFQALDPDNAWHLFSKPIEALGLTLQCPDTMRAQVLQQTSRMPHLIQAAARSAVETALATHSTQISASLLRRGHDPFADFSMLRSHLEDLRDDHSRIAATTVLLGQREGLHKAEAIQTALAKDGLHLSAAGITAVCDDLVINCLLGWEENGYAAPRWDICQTAQRHPQHLLAIRAECFTRLRASSK